MTDIKQISSIRTAAVLVFCLSALTAGAQTAEEIIREVDERNRTDTSVMNLIMDVYPDSRDERDSRRFVITGYGRGESESTMVFTEPRSLNGLSLLSLGDDQWIYFPSTGRVRKIAGRSKNESVQGVGGDFSYEDLSAGDWLEKYEFAIIDENRRTWTLSGNPRKDSSYSRIEVTIDKRRWQVIRVLYWQNGQAPVKELIMDDFRNLDGREVASVTTMMNLEKGSKTIITTTDAEWNPPLNDARFSPHRFWK